MNHPYEKYEKTEIWTIVSKALIELQKNQDIEITTKEEYVIGFLCKKITLYTKNLDIRETKKGR